MSAAVFCIERCTAFVTTNICMSTMWASQEIKPPGTPFMVANGRVTPTGKNYSDLFEVAIRLSNVGR
jgi:glutamine cyclotransferase